MNLWSFSLGAVVLCGAFSFYWFGRLFRGIRVLRTDLDIFIAAYLGFFILSITFSKVPYLSYVELFKLMVVLCAFWATRYVCRERLQIYRLSESFVLMGGLYSAIGLLQFLGGLPKGWWSRPYYLSSTYVNHNHFAGFLNLVLPISLGFVLAERDRSKKILFLFMSVLMGVALVFTLSRGAFVAFGISMVFMIVVLKRRHLISAGVMPLIVFIGLVLCAVIVFGTGPIEQRIGDIQRMTAEEEMSLKTRWLTWQGSLRMILHFFWQGSGPGTFGNLFLQFRPPAFFSLRAAHALNDFLQLWAECGVFTFLAAACLTIAFFLKGLGIIHRDESRLRIGVGSGILAGMLGLLVHGLFNFNFHIPANWLLSSVAAGLLFAMDDDKFYHSKVATSALKVFISTMLFFVLAASFYLGIADYHLWEARQLIKEGELIGARTAAEKSLRLNPWDAEAHYLRGFLGRPEDVQRSVKDFDDAIKLNGYEPVYDMAKARALARSLAVQSPSELVALFKQAVDKDPNNQELVSMVAAETFGRGDGAQFSALREQTGKMLEQRRETLAGLVAGLEKLGLWQYHRLYHLKLLGLDPDALKRSSPSDLWNRQPSHVFTLDDFSSSAVEPVAKKDVFFRNGELTKKIDAYDSLARIVLKASGNAVKGVYPTIYVKLDGKVVDEHYMNSKTYKNYFTDMKLSAGSHVLGLEYVNDLCIGNHPSEDRNVSIQRVSVVEV